MVASEQASISMILVSYLNDLGCILNPVALDRSPLADFLVLAINRNTALSDIVLSRGPDLTFTAHQDGMMSCTRGLNNPRCCGCARKRFCGNLVCEFRRSLRQDSGSDTETRESVSSDKVGVSVDCCEMSAGRRFLQIVEAYCRCKQREGQCSHSRVWQS